MSCVFPSPIISVRPSTYDILCAVFGLHTLHNVSLMPSLYLIHLLLASLILARSVSFVLVSHDAPLYCLLSLFLFSAAFCSFVQWLLFL